MGIEFVCPFCKNQVADDSSDFGEKATCSHCGTDVLMPTKPSADEKIFCLNCGVQNIKNNFKCTSCAYVLHGRQPRPAVEMDSSLGGRVPYKNAKALVAYYLGVFSLIPFVGILLGIMGLRYAGNHPQSKGKVHAWVGIVLGGICALGYGLMFAAIIISAFTDM